MPRRMERTLCSLLGGVGVCATGDGLEASAKWSSVLTCCCLTSKRDCSEETERERGSMGVHQIKIMCSWVPQGPFKLIILLQFNNINTEIPLNLSLSAEINLFGSHRSLQHRCVSSVSQG